MIRCKPKKNGSQNHKISISPKQLERVKKEIAKEMTDKVAIIMISAIAHEIEDKIDRLYAMRRELKIGQDRADKIAEIFRFDDEALCKAMERVDRYAGYHEQHLTTLRDYQKSIEKSTGAVLKGW